MPQPCFLKQPVDRAKAEIEQPSPHMVAAFACDLHGARCGHDCDKAIRQRRGEQRIGVRPPAPPGKRLEPFARQTDLLHEPEIHLRDAAQARKQDRVRSQLLAQRLHRLPGEPRQQMRASPEILRFPRRRNEALHRADRNSQQRRLLFGIAGECACEGGHQIQVVPDRVIRHARVGGQQLPELAQRRGVLALRGSPARTATARAPPCASRALPRFQPAPSSCSEVGEVVRSCAP